MAGTWTGSERFDQTREEDDASLSTLAARSLSSFASHSGRLGSAVPCRAVHHRVSPIESAPIEASRVMCNLMRAHGRTDARTGPSTRRGAESGSGNAWVRRVRAAPRSLESTDAHTRARTWSAALIRMTAWSELTQRQEHDDNASDIFPSRHATHHLSTAAWMIGRVLGRQRSAFTFGDVRLWWRHELITTRRRGAGISH